LISHKHKYIFIHIPRTGGTSVEFALLDYENVDYNLNDEVPLRTLSKDNKHKFGLRRGSKQHLPLIEYPDEQRQTYYCFTFVRNPWDLLLSEYYYSHDYRQTQFKDFLLSPKHTSKYHLMPQHEFINDDIDYIGRFENLQIDFNEVCDKIGIPRQQLSHSNKTVHKHYAEYYNDETRDIVAKKYAKDIEIFGYEFGE